MAQEKIRITLECGHVSMLRGRTTAEGYTHDWEVFVRGVDNTDISHYVEKVVFHLHDTFPKPKRILKEPPYIVKESGYAGFLIPVDIYLKNKDEPKRIQIQYDLQLQQSGPAINEVIRHTEVFMNPADDFRKKLLKGGGVIVSNVDEGHGRNESKFSVAMVGKPKLSGSDGKKHRTEPKSTNDFVDCFGTPIKTAKVSPENKKAPTDKAYHKTPPDRSEKTEKVNKSKHSPHKDSKREKNGEEKKDKKSKEASKEKERSKEKSNKRPPSPVSKSSHQSPSSKRPSSPVAVKKQLSPLDSVSIPKSASPKIREREHKKVVNDKDKDKQKEKSKESLKGSTEELKNDKKKKKHKDDKDAERKDKIRDKDRDKMKELKSSEKKAVEKSEKHDKSDREKVQDANKSTKDIKKSPKPVKEGDRSSSKSRNEKVEVTEKVKDARTDKDRQKHKHKKKEKKERSDESREREKRDKRDKQKNSFEKDGGGSSNSVAQSNTSLAFLPEVLERDSSDSANSGDEEDSKPLTSAKAEQELSRNPAPDNRPQRSLSPSGSEHAKRERSEKMKKEKLKPLRNEERDSNRKRKRRSGSKGEDEIPVKREKDTGFSPPLEPVSSSQSPVTVEMASAYNVKNESEEVEAHPKQDFEAESEQIAPDSTNSVLIESENDEPLVFSEDYVSQLKDLQQKIMTLQDNQELQRVVQVIAATGQYEITRKTFDFDLCALDRRTVQRLQQFFSTS